MHTKHFYIMKRITLIIVVLALIIPANAQFWRQLGNAAENAAKDAAIRNAEKATERAIDTAAEGVQDEAYGATEDAINESKNKNKDKNANKESGWTCPACGHKGNTGKFCTECGAKKPEGDGSWICPSCGAKGQKGKFCTECGAKKPEAGGGQPASGGQPAAASNQPAAPAVADRAAGEWKKFDFVPGDVVIYYDQLEGEQLGEFPSKWELVNGECEIQKSNGENVIALMPHCNIMPLMKTTWNYLPDVYTVEFDYYDFVENDGEDFGDLHVSFYAPNNGGNERGSWLWGFTFDNFAEKYTLKDQDFYKDFHTTVWATTTDKSVDNTNRIERVEPNKWHHVSVSVNKRAIKVYFDEKRVFNLPNYKNPNGGHIEFTYDFSKTPAYIKNVRIAKGAVPLYDRMMTDGKFITYGITFDVGKAIIKPESMGEINRIVALMNENPDLKFEVQGHTDATGKADSNQKLSEQRAQAIVAKLVEMGISADRLTAVGKGQTSPIADNSTDEGRAKNRRVEFVKK